MPGSGGQSADASVGGSWQIYIVVPGPRQDSRASKSRRGVNLIEHGNRRPSSKTVHVGGRPIASLINDNFERLERVENSLGESPLFEM